MQSPLDGTRLGLGGQQLASVSSFGGAEPLRLPFDVQRYHLFLAAVAAVAMALVAAATGLSPLVGLALIAAIAVAFAVALNEMIGLVLLAALAPACAGLARGIPVPGFRFSEVLIGGVGVILLVSARRFVRWTALDWMALLYAVATLCIGGWDLLSQGQHINRGELDTLLGPLQFLLLYRATAVTARTPERRRLALRVMLWASLPVALLALGQQFNLPGIRSLIVTLTGNDVYSAGDSAARVTGPFPLWHNLAGYLLMYLLTIAALLLGGVTDVMRRSFLILIALIDAAALLETLSIAPIIALVAGVAILGVWFKGITRVFAGLAVVIVAGLLLFGARIDARVTQEYGRAPGTQGSALVPSTIQYRYDLWTNELLPALKGHVTTGYGPVLPAQFANFPWTESLYVNLLYRGGVILVVIFLGLATTMIAAGFAARRDRDPLQKALGAAVVVGALSLVVIGLIESYFTDDGPPQVLWMLLGLLAFRDAVPMSAYASRVHDAVNRRAWASNVAMALETLDPGSQDLLRLSYQHGLSDDELVGVLRLSDEAIVEWRSAALQRVALRANMSPPAVERVLRTQEPSAVMT
ncbi:MAG: O-antigen ligase family protein [Solirubrobacterales bacterium]|nr:O-antigen ligase family protein [Solirubrobacterales bacterium]